MPELPSQNIVDRLRLWGETLTGLADDERSQQLVRVLNEGDVRGLERLVGRGLFSQGGCISVVDTLTRVLNGGFRPQERCEVLPRLRPFDPSTTDGRIYRLSDGRFLFVTDAEWWAYYDHAAQDPAWLSENRALLRALGIVTCSIRLVASNEIVSVDRSRTLCFQDVTRPWDQDPD